MKRTISVTACIVAMIGLLAPRSGLATNSALIIEAFKPEEFDVETHNNNHGSVVWNDPYLAYELVGIDSCSNIMRFGRIPEERVHFLYANGTEWDSSGGRYKSARLQLQYDMVADSADTATVRQYMYALAHGDSVHGRWVAPLSAATHDTLFVYLAGHGGWSGDNACLQVRPCTLVTQPGASFYVGMPLWDTTFKRMLDEISCDARILVMQQCGSGGFIDKVGGDNTAIICASAEHRLAWRADNLSKAHNAVIENEWDPNRQQRQYHGEFSFHFMNALRGRAIEPGTPLYFDPDPAGDGVDWIDAFTYVSAVDSREQPVCSIPGMDPWLSRTDVPAGPKNKNVKAGGALAATNDTFGQWTIYAFKGNNTCEFYSYNLEYNTWQSRESIPAVGHLGKKKLVKEGGSLAAIKDKTYAVKGNNTLEFWEYDTSSRHWTQKADVPPGAGKGVKSGGSLVARLDSTDTLIYLLKGGKGQEFFCYNPRTESWSSMANAPLGASGKGWDKGSCLAFALDSGVSTIYALKGSSTSYTHTTCAPTRGRPWPHCRCVSAALSTARR